MNKNEFLQKMPSASVNVFDLQINIMENQDFRLLIEAERNICTENYVFHGEYQLET